MKQPRSVPLLLVLVLGAAADEPLALLLRGLGGRERLEAVREFSYRLTITEADGRVVRDRRERLDPATGRIERTELPTGERTLWDGTAGWRVRGDAREPLPEAEARALRDAGAYNFIRLFRDPATRVERLSTSRLRITLGHGDSFEVVVDSASGRILENHFGPGAIGIERGWRDCDGIVWPMEFESRSVSGPPRFGRFSEVVFVFAP